MLSPPPTDPLGPAVRSTCRVRFDDALTSLIVSVPVAAQIRSTVALALAALAIPKRIVTLPNATAKIFRIVLFRRFLTLP
jgi:hypothetical protein